MPNLPLRRKSGKPQGKITGRVCAHCHQDLRLVHRHTSPARLGAQLTTEFYQCRACDAGFAFTPATGKWKPWVGDED